VADRSVKVTIGASLAGLVEEFRKGQKAATSFSDGLKKGIASNDESIRTLGTGLATIGAVAGAGVGLAVTKFADFDQAMSSVQAATHETAGNMGLLRDAALEAGSSTVFSATESANAIEELSKAGLSTAEILSGGLAGALDLAAAGGLEVADAAQQTAIALKQFGLDGDQASHVADLLAAGAGKAVGDVSDLSAALAQSGLVANQTGLSIEETTGVLAAFADQGLLGSDAGTSLKTMLQSLTPSSAAAREEMEKLGISAFDAQGQFVGITDFAGQYRSALSKLSPEQQAASSKIIFGSDAVRAANVLYTQGAEGIQKYIDQTNDAGYAAETAAIRLDNLKGDVEALGGALDTALIQTGSGANGALRGLTQGATEAVEAYANLDPAVQGTNLALGAGVAALSTAGGAFLLAAPKVIEFRAAVDQLGPGAQKASAAIAALGKAAGAATAIVGLALAADKLSNANDKAAVSVEATSKALRSSDIESLFSGLGQDVDSYADSLRLLTGDDVNSKMERFGSTLNGALFGGAFSDQVSQTKEQLDTVGESLGQLVSGGDGDRAAALFDELAAGAAKEGVSRKELLELMPAYRDALSGTTSEQEKATGATSDQAEALAGLSGVAQAAEGDVKDLADAISGFGQTQFDVNTTTRDFEASIDDATAALEKNGQTLDVGTEAGRANGAALDGIADSALSMSAAIITQTNDQEAASAAIQRGRDAYIAASVAAGVSEEAANAYADQLGLIPSNVSTAIGATGVTKTQADIDAIQQNLAETIRNLQINIRAAVDRSQLDSLLSSIRTARSELTDLNGASSGSGRMGTYATGGPVFGPGTGTSDSIRAWLSNGEHVLTAREVRAAGGHGNIMAWRREILSGQKATAYAAGGPVGAPVSPRYAPPSVSPRVSVAPATVILNTPVYADGSLIGTMRGIAGQEVQFALATETTRLNQKWRPE